MEAILAFRKLVTQQLLLLGEAFQRDAAHPAAIPTRELAALQTYDKAIVHFRRQGRVEQLVAEWEAGLAALAAAARRAAEEDDQAAVLSPIITEVVKAQQQLFRTVLRALHAGARALPQSDDYSHTLARLDQMIAVAAEKDQPASGAAQRKRALSDSTPLTAKQLEAVHMVGECQGNIAEAARRLGKSRSTIARHYKAAMAKLAEAPPPRTSNQSPGSTDRAKPEHRANGADRR